MKKLFFTLCTFMAAMTAVAAVRTPEAAARLAADFTNHQPTLSKMHRVARTASTMTLAHTFMKPMSEEAALYAFNQEDNGGFVLVSADDQTKAILCYSDEGQFNLATANPEFLWWINRYAKEIANVNAGNAYTGDSSQTTAISPMLGNIAWDQEAPYYSKCPMDLWQPNERCWTGCIATAAAQVMRYWQYPAQGTGTHTYTWHCCMDANCDSTMTQDLTLDFSTLTFDWANMLDTYEGINYTTAQGDAVATLMYACGIACDMHYGGNTIGGSIAYLDDMGLGLMTYLGYKNTARFITTYSEEHYAQWDGKGSACVMTNVSWEQTIAQLTAAFNTELEAGRPILICGEIERLQIGHAFVCDGRDASGMFHINWGWSGHCNCYCSLSALTPDGTDYTFSDRISAIIGLEPAVNTGIAVAPAMAPAATSAEKFIRDGQLFIRRNGKVYTAAGAMIR